MNALTEYNRFFPHFTPNIFQQELIEDRVTDLGAWRKVLTVWAGNDYRPQSVFKMLELYDKECRAVPETPEQIVAALHREDAQLTDPNLSEIAVLQVLMTRQITKPDAEPIKAIQYFLPAARQIHAESCVSPENVAAILSVRRQQFVSERFIATRKNFSQ